MAAQPKTAEELKAADDAMLQAGEIYATSIGVAGAQFNAQLVFQSMRVLPSGASADRPLVVAIISWQTAKILHVQLGELLRQYEATAGEVTLPKGWQEGFDAYVASKTTKSADPQPE